MADIKKQNIFKNGVVDEDLLSTGAENSVYLGISSKITL